MMNCPQRRAQNPEPETWNLELETWNLKPGTFNLQSGFLLVTAIFLLVILAALGAFILTISGTQQTSSALDVQGSRAYQAARAGIDWASYQLLISTGGCAGYLYERSVTIDHTKVPNTDQSNFPVLFSGTYAGGGGSLDLRTVANGGKVTNASGFDIIFTDSAGAKLDHEIESYSATTGAVNFWVRVPTVSHTTDTVIYLCYRNAAITTSQENKTGVWNTNFMGVWHLKEDPSGAAPQMMDSTSNARNGTSGGAMPGSAQAAGKVDGSLTFDGSNDTISLGTSFPGLGTTFTIEGWVFFNSFASIPFVFGREKFTNLDYRVVRDGSTNQLRGEVNYKALEPADASANSTLALSTATWYRFALVKTSTNLTMYINAAAGTPTATSGTLNNNATINVTMALRDDASQALDGKLDEIRVSNIARTADWLTTDYNNQNSPSTFYTLGAESAAGSSYATDCNPGPTTQNVTGMGGTLSGFTASVTCSSATYTEGGSTWTVYQVTSTGAAGTAGTLDRVERELQVTLIK